MICGDWEPTSKLSFRDKARRVELLLLDVDGVLTDGTFERRGDEEIKRFHSRDGVGLVMARRAGIKIGLISGRTSAAVSMRAQELQMTFVRLGVADKREAYLEALAQEGLTDEQVAFMGDDLPDLALLQRAGFSAAPADAHVEVRSRVDYVTGARGGAGAVRELIDQILSAKGVLAKMIEDYSGWP
jgi:3-deoxy-D-manno-octulosonate 8-phosphate phosphatase (KDO 8-P phosphatase)